MAMASCLTLLMLEMVFRVVYFQPKGRAAVPFEFEMSTLPGIPYELSPGKDYTWKYGARYLFDSGFTIPVSTNSNGYRDKELIDPKPENIYRILALGDSFTWGLGVNADDCWVEMLEQTLNSTEQNSILPQDKKIEVVNTGVGSWNTEVEASYLAQKGMTHKPDAVILGFLSNDFRSKTTDYIIDEDGYLTTNLSDGKNRLHLQSLVFNDKSNRPLWKRFIESSHVIRWASGRRMKTEKKMLMHFNDKNSKKKTRDALEKINNVTAAAGIPFYVCVFPTVEDPVPDSEYQDLMLVGKWCEEMDVSWVYMGDALTGLPSPELWVHPRDHHPNAQAHEKYANLIYNAFFQKKE